MILRPADPGDLPAILAIFNRVVETSTAVYRDDPVDLADRAAWYEARRAQNYPVLVAEAAGGVAGFSAFGDFRSYPGYRTCVEHTVHVAETARGRGVGAALVDALFEPARALGKLTMIGAIDAENDGSIRFHARLGFREVGRFPGVGVKFGRRLTLVCMQRDLD